MGRGGRGQRDPWPTLPPLDLRHGPKHSGLIRAPPWPPPPLPEGSRAVSPGTWGVVPLSHALPQGGCLSRAVTNACGFPSTEAPPPLAQGGWAQCLGAPLPLTSASEANSDTAPC